MAASGGTKALLLAHSMGNLVSLAFLRMHTPAWRAQHIAALVALSGPWGGSVTAMKGALCPCPPAQDRPSPSGLSISDAGCALTAMPLGRQARLACGKPGQLCPLLVKLRAALLHRSRVAPSKVSHMRECGEAHVVPRRVH